MPQSNQRNQALAEAAAAVVANDTTLKDELSKLVTDIVKYQRYVMLAGSPSDKIALVKAVLPQMLGAMNTVTRNEEEAAERAAYERIMAMMRGETPAFESPNLKVV